MPADELVVERSVGAYQTAARFRERAVAERLTALPTVVEIVPVTVIAPVLLIVTVPPSVWLIPLTLKVAAVFARVIDRTRYSWRRIRRRCWVRPAFDPTRNWWSACRWC